MGLKFTFLFRQGWCRSLFIVLLLSCQFASAISATYSRPFSGRFAERTITGRVVTQEDNSPIPGVTVVIKGTTIGTNTDVDGKYQLKVNDDNAILVFSAVGYVSQEKPIGNLSILDVTLASDQKMLNEVVVVGYGTQKKRDLTGAVSQINTTKLENENPNSVQDILRGNVAGLSVGMSPSAKGGGSLLVRGRNSLNAATSPLLVLDGAIYYGELSDINPNDIETIDVLKDASSAAVFGAKAASGVILITTKKGKEGKPTININTNIGMASVGRNQPVYSPDGFVSWRSDVMKNINSTYKPGQFDNPANLPAGVTTDQWLAYDGSKGDPTTVWLQRLGMQPIEIENYKAGRSVDWYNMIFQNGMRQDHTVSVSGRNDGTNYYFSLGYLDNKGMLYNDRFKTVRGRLNLETKISKFLSVGVTTQFSDRDESPVVVDYNLARTLSPWGTPLNDDGTYKWRPNNEASGGNHPYYNLSLTDQKIKYTTLNTTLFGLVTLPFGITYRVNFTPRYEFYEKFNAISSKHADYAATGGTASRQEYKVYYWQVDNILKWNKTFGAHNFDVTLLANAEKYQKWDNTMTNKGFLPTDALGYHGISTGTSPTVTSNDEYSTGDGLMARLFYSLKDRYMVTLSTRRDGYSAFGQKNPRALFSSAALGWVFTDEKFFKSSWLNYGKLRLSWGSNGNRDIGRYVALSDLTTGKYLYVKQDGTVYQANQLYVNRMQNPNLKWERTSSLNLGLDFGILNNKIDGSVEFYKSSTKDLLVQRSLPNVVGFDWVMDNLGEVQNRGIEFSLNSVNFDRPNFSWRSMATFQLNRNKIVHLYGDKDANGKEIDDVANRWFIGHSIDEIWNFQVDGVWQTSEKEQATKYGVRPGDFKIRDVDNDGKYTNADKVFQGWTNPRFRWTLRNEFKLFKSIDVSFVLYSYWGHKAAFNQAKNIDGFLDRTSSYILPYWTPDNPINDYARLYSSEGGATGFGVYKYRSFIRLDNISVGYSLPKSLVQKASIQNIKFFASVRNVGYYAPQWNYWDAEPDSDGNNVPVPRILTAGIDITL
ncbi:SusC/RagA family TonB-linked outer membrane protein [Larkinella terrae]|uniref:SusC/RagA family TonB-linked outer membrane protein n=1 Tax=Larkinella terrae TaxID=2025311 RepID=A0A7K0EEP9_9BACT|nr:TonB-dependent receptor [Larkinella terrae]MRS59938.1 SusC/RagA family TonB-linked outer membrane protein [Larkinella terrae]